MMLYPLKIKLSKYSYPRLPMFLLLLQHTRGDTGDKGVNKHHNNRGNNL